MHAQLEGNDSHSDDTLLEPLCQDKDLNQSAIQSFPPTVLHYMQHHHSLHYSFHEYSWWAAEISFEADRYS